LENNDPMKVILVLVISLDGKITKWGNPLVNEWTSQEDKDYFQSLWKSSPLIVMGSNTYRAGKVAHVEGQRIIVMTRFPADYKETGAEKRFEFTDETPQDLVSRLRGENVQQMIVVGGAQVATSFLKATLADELWLTIEPNLFGLGGNLVEEEKLDIRLELLHVEKAGPRGTLFTKYRVLK
jgi:dihydrofolate reductase